MKFDILFQQLKQTYLQEFATIDKARHPIKMSIPLSGDANNATAYLNIMTAQVQGIIGTKMIYVNEETHQCSAKTLLYENGEIICLESHDLTKLRCALMAAIAIEIAGFSDKSIKVGFIGYGGINQKTQEVLADIFKISQFCIFNHHTHGNIQELHQCDIIISATNNRSQHQQLSPSGFQGKLFIAQDTGYLFNQDFRVKYPSFCDYPEQLQQHFLDEFPFDSLNQTSFLPLTQLHSSNIPAVVYLYGIALADLVVAQYEKKDHD